MIRKPERIRFIFNKLRGDNASTKTWEEFDSSQRCSILEGVHLNAGEVPVVGLTQCPNPVLITTQRVIWHTGEGPKTICLDEVASVQAPDFFESSKLDVHQLLITTHDGREHSLETQPGDPLFVLWNLLLGIIDRPKTGFGLLPPTPEA